MASYTENLNLLKKDPVADANDTFNIQTMMNDNWDKIDAAALKVQPAKAAPVDADRMPLVDSADSSKTKLITWANIKAALSSVFAALNHTHTKSQITDFPASMTPTAHAASHKTGGTDALTPNDISAASKPTIVTATFAVASWAKNTTTNCYEQTVAVAGLLATDGKNIRVEPVGSTDATAQALTDAAYAVMAGPGGRMACNTDGQLYARCPAGAAAPTTNFQVAVVISR